MATPVPSLTCVPTATVLSQHLRILTRFLLSRFNGLLKSLVSSQISAAVKAALFVCLSCIRQILTSISCAAVETLPGVTAVADSCARWICIRACMLTTAIHMLLREVGPLATVTGVRLSVLSAPAGNAAVTVKLSVVSLNLGVEP